jgi:hypothetical protein
MKTHFFLTLFLIFTNALANVDPNENQSLSAKKKTPQVAAYDHAWPLFLYYCVKHEITPTACKTWYQTISELEKNKIIEEQKKIAYDVDALNKMCTHYNIPPSDCRRMHAVMAKVALNQKKKLEQSAEVTTPTGTTDAIQ